MQKTPMHPRPETLCQGMPRPEVLSPAGDFEKLQTAVQYGADAVYLGANQFTMRAAPKNFEDGALGEAVRFAHENGVRVYLTCNTFAHNEEIDGLDTFLTSAAAAGIDALIAADIGVMMRARRLIPDVPLHVSTQAGVVNYCTASELYELGAKRVVLARELSLDEIRTLREKTPAGLELEAFVHGSMCMSVSGRCLLSDYLAGRDANRGDCAQPCRWRWRLTEEKRPGEAFPIYQEDGYSYILNARDLCMIEHLDALWRAGVSSFKIEGRAKSAYYAGVITNAYKAASLSLCSAPADSWKPPAWAVGEMERVSHRQYSTGFYFGRPQPGQCYENGGYIRGWDVVAVAIGYGQGTLIVSQRNRFSRGDDLEALPPGKGPFPIHAGTLFDAQGTPIEKACHPVMEVRIPGAPELPAGTLLRKRRDKGRDGR